MFSFLNKFLIYFFLMMKRIMCHYMNAWKDMYNCFYFHVVIKAPVCRTLHVFWFQVFIAFLTIMLWYLACHAIPVKSCFDFCKSIPNQIENIINRKNITTINRFWWYQSENFLGEFSIRQCKDKDMHLLYETYAPVQVLICAPTCCLQRA